MKVKEVQLKVMASKKDKKVKKSYTKSRKTVLLDHKNANYKIPAILMKIVWNVCLYNWTLL